MRNAITTLFVAGFFQGCIVATTTQTQDLEFTEAVAHLEVDTGAGRIEAIVDPSVDRIEVQQTLRYSGEPPEIEGYVEGDTLVLRSRCDRGGWRVACSVDFVIRVPEATSLLADTGSGAIVAEGLQGDLVASTGSGRIEMRDVVGTLEADTGSGRIDVITSELSQASADTGSGSVSLDLLVAPDLVEVDTGSGGVDIWVPEGAYDLRISTGSGRVTTTGITDDPSATSQIRVDTGSGGVRLNGV
ncbi:MAG: DUF4097 domain-containing protein [Myxococcales bacterium]|nr:DUF4097 domain-containing protein [Myxococcales bacterium]